MERKNLLAGVHLTEIPADKFKRCRITVNFMVKGVRDEATVLALLPMVMGRGFAACPDMTKLSMRLAQLYGASLATDSYTQGANRIVSFAISGIKDAYAPGGEQLTKEYLSLLCETIFRPDIKDDAFDAEAVEVEKNKLRELCESEINDKKIYCMKQARRRFFGDSPAGLERYGYPEEIAAITEKQLCEAWKKLLREAEVEIFVMGTDAVQVEDTLCAELKKIDRCPQETYSMSAAAPREPAYYTEGIDAVQGKVCMLFTAGEVIPVEELPVMRMTAALFGGVPTSRLFMNVREKQSLCYYCSAGYTQINGIMMVNSGVEFDKAEKLTAAVLKEWNCMKEEPVTQKEMDDTRRQLQCAMHAVNDSMSALDNWYSSEVSRGTLITPEEAARQLEQVTAEDVKACMQRFTLSLVYTLTKEGGDA